MKELAHVNKYLLKYKYHLLLGILFTAIANVFSIIPAQIVRIAFDLVGDTISVFPLYKGSFLREGLYDIFISVVFLFGIVVTAMAIIKGVFLFFMRQTIIVMSRLIEYDLKNEIYEHYQTLPLSFYKRNNTGDLMSRVSEDVGKVRMYVGPAIMYGINMLVSFILVVGFMLSVNPSLTFYSLLPLPILSLSIYFVNTHIHSRSAAVQKQLSGITTFTQQAFSGIRVLKAFVREEDSIKKFEKESDSYKEKAIRLVTVNALFSPLMLLLIGFSTIATVYIGGLKVIEGSLSSGNIAEFIIYINMLVWPVTSLGWITSITQEAAASQGRINEFLQVKTDIVSEKNITEPIQGGFSFQNVSFTYPDSGITALENISFSVKEGGTLAILGTTGSGKSTIASLLCRQYDPTSGGLFIDGTNIKDYALQHLRGNIGYVPQDVFLFSDTIRNNIAFGKDAVTNDQIYAAARTADFYDNVMSFPEKFETIVGERGVTLSGGQKQRASIARALIRNPKILILDDCLSAVDTKTENAILNNLKAMLGQCTTLIISHRVSSTKLADTIVVLDNGKIVETGSHTELLQLKGVYADLYEKQLKTEDAAN